MAVWMRSLVLDEQARSRKDIRMNEGIMLALLIALGTLWVASMMGTRIRRTL
jgi:hypothetical protein